MSIKNWSACFTPYNEDAVRRAIPPGGGVYALWLYYTTGKCRCFYVGKADNLESRLLAHLRPDEQNECIKGKVKYLCGFNWMGITTETERSGAEKYLYDTMKPGCNLSDPGGRPLQVPLPPTP